MQSDNFFERDKNETQCFRYRIFLSLFSAAIEQCALEFDMTTEVAI